MSQSRRNSFNDCYMRAFLISVVAIFAHGANEHGKEEKQSCVES